MKKWFLLVIAICVVALGACGKGTNESAASSDEKITIKHELGSTEVVKDPKKVVVFDFGALDTLDELGVEVAGLPKELVPAYLKQYEAEQYTNVGSLKEPNFEAISELAPDVILISARQSEMYKEFSKIAPTIYVGIDTQDYMTSFKDNVNMLGELFGKEAEATAALKEVDEKIVAVKEDAKEAPESLVLLAGDKSMSAFGPGSRFGLIYDAFGLKAIDTTLDQSVHGQDVSYEYIVKKNPGIIFVIDRGEAIGEGATAKQAMDNELLKNVDAVKNNKVVYLSGDVWYLSGGGIQSIEKMLEEIKTAL